ncbi:unnamed protein product [Brassica oleracea var. botrytis]|uniref:(rape) hypothetical protein n=1 Tax=Brassica napus TaxID=3708 RepID=A0A816IR28_BRANA|nr:unnamed protein product [Brassica napus]
MSGCEDNDEILGDVACGKKRSATERSSTDLHPLPKKRQAHRALVWQHFIQKEDNLSLCNCRCCGQEIGCDTKKSGTSAVMNHINRCKLFQTFEASGGQQGLGTDSGGVVTAVKYDVGLFRRSVNEMIVLMSCRFLLWSQRGLGGSVTISLQKNSNRRYIWMFMKEKSSLKHLFCSDQKRVSLTTDIWTTPTTSYSYMVVTAHWIDRNWDMQKRIISFNPVTDHKGETIAEHLSQCLVDWGIEKVFTVTVDNAKGNDKALRLFTEACRELGPNALIKDGTLLHIRCCAHVLNLIVRDGLAEVKESVMAIRNAVKYVRSSGTRLQSFQLRVLTGKGGDEVHRLVKFLKLFFGSTLAFSASKSVTSTSCYNEIVTIERNMIALSNNRDDLLRIQATEMRTKFEKYWDGLINMNLLVIIASVFDPRNKMQFASICFDKLYGKDSVESAHLRTSISTLMKQLYEEYVVKIGPPSQGDSTGNMSENAETVACLFEMSDDDEEYEGIDSLYSEMVSKAANEEASKTAFSTSGRILDHFRSCLTPYMIEALVCTQQWLRNSISAEKLASLTQMFEELDFHESLETLTIPEELNN